MSSVPIHFRVIIFFMNLNWCAKDCWRLKDTKDTPDATLKTGKIKDVKVRLPSKDLQIETSVDMQPY